jgi:hypothetical protein
LRECRNERRPGYHTGPPDDDVARTYETSSLAILMRLIGVILTRCAHAAMRRTRARPTTPEIVSARAAVKGSHVLPPVSGSEPAAEELVVALAEALALEEALAVALVLASSRTRRTSRLSA